MPRFSLVITAHAARRMRQYHVRSPDVRQVIDTGEVLRRYPEDRPHESRLALGFTDTGPLHVVAADAEAEQVTYVITVYRPDPNVWEDDFRRKRHG